MRFVLAAYGSRGDIEPCVAVAGESTLDSLIADLRVILTPQYAIRAKTLAKQMTSPAESLARAADLLEEAAAHSRQD